MKQITWKYGIISAGINALLMFSYWLSVSGKADFTYKGMLIGYASMCLALSVIFVGVRELARQKGDFGVSFGRAFTLGLLITLISAVGYSFSWMILNHFVYPDFMNEYVQHEMNALRASGSSEAVIQAKMADMNKFREMYKNPFIAFLFTMAEILPVGILFSLIAAFMFKRKPVKIQTL